MKKNICFLLLFLLVVSCTKTQTNTSGYTYLNEDELPILQQVEFKKIELPEDECMNSHFIVYHDSILVVMHHSPDPYMMTIMNLNTMEVIGRYLTKGRGPGEMIRCYDQIRDNRLMIDDRMMKKVAIFNIDSLLPIGQSYNPKMLQLGNFDYLSYDALTDTSFVYYNILYLENCGNDINEEIPELFVSGKDGSVNYDYPEGISSVSGNGALILTDINRGRTFLAYRHKPQFTILNTNLDTISVIYGPEPIEKYEYDNNPLFGITPKLYNEYARAAISTENYVLVATKRLRNISKDDILEERKNNKPEIFKFDWDGSIVARYQVMNFYALSGYSESTNTIYLTAKDENEELCLYKAKL